MIERIDGGILEHLDLTTANLVTPLNPPPTGTYSYKLTLHATNLSTDHALALVILSNEPELVLHQANNGQTSDILEYEALKNFDEGQSIIALRDYNATSTDVTLEWDLYLDTSYGSPPVSVAEGLYASESDLDDLRGIDAITSWSDLEGSNTRNHNRIMRALTWSEAKIAEMLQNVYTFPLTSLSNTDKEVLKYWSAVLASYRLYIHRGQRDVVNPMILGKNAFTPEIQSVLDDIWKYQNQTRRFSSPSKGSRILVGKPSTARQLFYVLDPL